MTDAELEVLIESLRRAAAAWFNDRQLARLEALIAEAKRARESEIALIKRKK